MNQDIPICLVNDDGKPAIYMSDKTTLKDMMEFAKNLKSELEQALQLSEDYSLILMYSMTEDLVLLDINIDDLGEMVQAVGFVWDKLESDSDIVLLKSEQNFDLPTPDQFEIEEQIYEQLEKMMMTLE